MGRGAATVGKTVTGEGEEGGDIASGTAGTVTGVLFGHGRPVLPPQMVRDEAIATRISPLVCSAAEEEPAKVRPRRTAHSAGRSALIG